MELWNAIPLRFQKRIFAKRLMSPLWRHDYHDGFDQRSTRKELTLTCVGRELEGVSEGEVLQRGDRGIIAPLPIPPTGLYNAVNVEYSA